jgi:CRISPR/Cas system CSM-associated protein Csm2 small subunit
MEQHTIESFAQQHNLSRQAALNLLSKLRKENKVTTSGGGSQKRMYTVTKLPQIKTNGFYDIINKYNKEKLVPQFKHIVRGNYTIERAIIDGIAMNDTRTKEATTYLFNHITNWKNLMHLAKKHGCEEEIHNLYNKARSQIKCKTMPKRYQK